MKKTWNKPTIQKMDILTTTLNGTTKGTERNNAGDKNKQPIIS